MTTQGVSQWMFACLWLAAVLLRLSEAQTVSSEIRRNYYDILNVEPTATDRQIKKVFHQLAMKYHPDKNKSSDAEKAFREIAEAYEVLSDKEKRREYDQWGHEAFLQHEDYFNPQSEYEASTFNFNSDDLFYIINMDDDGFLEEPHYRWTVPLDAEDEDNHYEHQSLLGNDVFEPRDNIYYGYGDEEEHEQFY